MDKKNGKITDEFVNVFSFLAKVVKVPTPTLAAFLSVKLSNRGKHCKQFQNEMPRNKTAIV